MEKEKRVYYHKKKPIKNNSQDTLEQSGDIKNHNIDENKKKYPKKKYNTPTLSKDTQYKKNSYPQHKKDFYPKEPQEPIVIFAHCKICGTGISNEAYAIKREEGIYIHFECALKKVKEIAVNSFSYGNKMKYTYIGTNTFAIYLEQGGANKPWKILQKVKVEEFLPLQNKEI